LNLPFETPGTFATFMMAARDAVPARYALKNATTVPSITGPHGLAKSTWGAPSIRARYFGGNVCEYVDSVSVSGEVVSAVPLTSSVGGW
jgi:hypothetical protein